MMFLLVSLIYLTLTVFYFDFVNFLAVWFNENGIRFQFGHVNEDIVFALLIALLIALLNIFFTKIKNPGLKNGRKI
jgi:hypothetical protein